MGWEVERGKYISGNLRVKRPIYTGVNNTILISNKMEGKDQHWGCPLTLCVCPSTSAVHSWTHTHAHTSTHIYELKKYLHIFSQTFCKRILFKILIDKGISMHRMTKIPHNFNIQNQSLSQWRNSICSIELIGVEAGFLEQQHLLNWEKGPKKLIVRCCRKP